jgi:hypothetical protein
MSGSQGKGMGAAPTEANDRHLLKAEYVQEDGQIIRRGRWAATGEARGEAKARSIGRQHADFGFSPKIRIRVPV